MSVFRGLNFFNVMLAPPPTENLLTLNAYKKMGDKIKNCMSLAKYQTQPTHLFFATLFMYKMLYHHHLSHVPVSDSFVAAKGPEVRYGGRVIKKHMRIAKAGVRRRYRCRYIISTCKDING